MNLNIEVPDEKYDAAVDAVRKVLGYDVVTAETSDQKVFAFNLNRVRFSEDQTWSNMLYMIVPKDAKSYDVLEILKTRIKKWLKTKDGWHANVCSSFDFNWGDFIDSLPLPECGVYLGDTIFKGFEVVPCCDQSVDQDELLAHGVMDTGTATFRDSSGNAILSLHATIHFYEGHVYFDSDDTKTSLGKISTRVATATVMTSAGVEFNLNPERSFKCIKNN